ncbi:MAG: CHAD domain-containing protein [Ilumatobacteraceae bacterium]
MGTDLTTFAFGPDLTGDVLAALRASGAQVGARRTVVRTVLDTFDGRLHRAGLRLELAKGACRTLIITGQSEVVPPLVVDRAPRRLGELPVGPMHDCVAAAIGQRVLIDQFSVKERRTIATWQNRHGELVLTGTLHEPLSDAGRPATTSAPMLELCAAPGRGKRYRRVVEVCDALGLQRTEVDSLYAAVDAGEANLGGYSASPTVPLDPAMPAIEGFHAVLGNLFLAVRAHWDGAALDLEPEFLHGLRVATRRSRCVVAQSKGVLPRRALEAASECLGWLGDLSGAARDLDVHLLQWERYARPLAPEAQAALEPVRVLLEKRRRTAHRALTKALRSPRASELTGAWEAWLEAPPARRRRSAAADAPLGPLVVECIERAHATLVEHGRLISDASPAEQLHDLRKDAKKLRYLVECFGGLLPSAPRKKFVRRLKRLQDNLGAHQDAEVHAVELVQLARGLRKREATAATSAAFAQLLELLDHRRESARAEFGARFAAFDSDDTSALLDRVLDLAGS